MRTVLADREIRLTAYRDSDADCSGTPGWDSGHSISEIIKPEEGSSTLMNPEDLHFDECASGASSSFIASCNDTNINVTYFSQPDCAGSVSSVATYANGECVPDSGTRRFIKLECVATPAFPVATIIGGTAGAVLALVLATLHDRSREG